MAAIQSAPIAEMEPILTILNRNGMALADVPFEHQTLELCMAAVTQCPFAIVYAAPDFRALEQLQLMAAKGDGRIILLLDQMEIEYSHTVWVAGMSQITTNMINSTSEVEVEGEVDSCVGSEDETWMCEEDWDW